jgi:hypothetical protein
MEDPNPSGSPGEGLGPSGARIFKKRMLGNAGANATGVGSWVGTESLREKTFFLYTVDQALALGSPVVEIHGCMELDPVDPDANTKFEILGTLNSAALSLSLGDVWRYMRVEVTTAATNHSQVGMNGLGV